ncbi:hypothetical protein ACFYVL_00450 [Streptomyces sp. NPDC004111]|uniref:hypothetical protein n=1 Tax=Streptomyces sp. NPDC004111 TaxID=3364690 RepID=UPI00368CFD39
MPLVHVHGVATRLSDKEERTQAHRTALYRAVLGPVLTASPSALTVLNPYWGDSAAAFAWNHASLPVGRSVEKFGGEGGDGGSEPDADAEVAAWLSVLTELSEDAGRAPLVALARQSPEDAVDLLWAVVAERALPEEADALAALGARASSAARLASPEQWLSAQMTDGQLLDRLIAEAETEPDAGNGPVQSPAPVESFGRSRSTGHGRADHRKAVWRLREAVTRVGSAAPRGVSSGAMVLRGWMHRQTSVFLGDVLTYLRQRETDGARGAIARTVGDALAEGAKARTADDPLLVVVAHSMGGNIVYDLLSHLRPELECDVLVTVGSQVGLFAELGLLPAVPPPLDPATDRAPVPANVGHWINVYDTTDVLGFATGRIFERGEDFRYSTGRGLLHAHSGYFLRPSFHHRLAERLRARPGASPDQAPDTAGATPTPAPAPAPAPAAE